eukprot:1148318-Pelagomonas_calceolata.AAC.1
MTDAGLQPQVEDFSTPFGNSDPDAELGSNVFTFSRWAMHRQTGPRSNAPASKTYARTLTPPNIVPLSLVFS